MWTGGRHCKRIGLCPCLQLHPNPPLSFYLYQGLSVSFLSCILYLFFEYFTLCSRSSRIVFPFTSPFSWYSFSLRLQNVALFPDASSGKRYIMNAKNTKSGHISYATRTLIGLAHCSTLQANLDSLFRDTCCSQ